MSLQTIQLDKMVNKFTYIKSVFQIQQLHLNFDFVLVEQYFCLYPVENDQNESTFPFGGWGADHHLLLLFIAMLSCFN